MPFELDPHPFGCPIAVGATPSQMREIITALCIKLQDVLRPSIHVINPSKGKAYPILNLHHGNDERPRVVVFPGWEDDDEAPKRRITWGRQMTLLQRIADAGVRGETLQQYGASSRSGDYTEPYVLAIARPAGDFREVLLDLQTYLGDLLELTVADVQDSGGPVPVVGVFAGVEAAPRVWCVPSWRGSREAPGERFKPHECQGIASLAAAQTQRRIGEVIDA
jgi:hypothetical protein